MNRKHIERRLKRVHEEFCASIKDEQVRKLVKKNSIITGGAIVSLLLSEKVSDYDYYFTDRETVLRVAQYYIDEFMRLNPKQDVKPSIVETGDRVKIKVKSKGFASETLQDGKYKYFEGGPDDEAEEYIDAEVDDVLKEVSEADEIPATVIETLGHLCPDCSRSKAINADDVAAGLCPKWWAIRDEDAEKDCQQAAKKKKREKYRPVFMTANAITLSDKIQLIVRFFGNAADIHANYDFVHCTNYWTSEKGTLYLNQPALESIMCMQLQYIGSRYPVCSVIRTRKFLKRGWTINAGQYLKMCFQLSQLDLTDIAVLEEQLVGVDTAYFTQLIEQLQVEAEKGSEEFKVDMNYICSLVDKIF